MVCGGVILVAPPRVPHAVGQYVCSAGLAIADVSQRGEPTHTVARVRTQAHGSRIGPPDTVQPDFPNDVVTPRLDVLTVNRNGIHLVDSELDSPPVVFESLAQVTVNTT